jgi:hypothetical protein
MKGKDLGTGGDRKQFAVTIDGHLIDAIDLCHPIETVVCPSIGAELVGREDQVALLECAARVERNVDMAHVVDGNNGQTGRESRQHIGTGG